MHQCQTCNVWLPTGYVHSGAECDEHVRRGRAIDRRADAIWCYVRLTGATVDAKPGDVLSCTANGVDTVATVTECPGRWPGTLNARIDGLQEHKLGKVSRDMFGSVEVEFLLNSDGRSCTALWWKR